MLIFTEHMLNFAPIADDLISNDVDRTKSNRMPRPGLGEIRFAVDFLWYYEMFRACPKLSVI